jgi:hypothetical protein
MHTIFRQELPSVYAFFLFTRAVGLAVENPGISPHGLFSSMPLSP